LPKKQLSLKPGICWRTSAMPVDMLEGRGYTDPTACQSVRRTTCPRDEAAAYAKRACQHARQQRLTGVATYGLLTGYATAASWCLTSGLPFCCISSGLPWQKWCCSRH
jgi:hypothetical protein